MYNNKLFYDYCDDLKIPLKTYFKNKISSLYLKKEVMNIMLAKDNKKIEKNELIFSEIENSFQFINEDLVSKKDIYKNNVEKMMIKKISKKFKNGKNEKKDYNGKMMNFSINDDLINQNLQSQKEILNSKIFLRKQKKILQGDLKRVGNFTKKN